MSDDSTGGTLCALGDAGWRKSSSSGEGECLVVKELEAEIAVRNSNDPVAKTLLVERPGLAAWIAGVKAGEFDDLTA